MSSSHEEAHSQVIEQFSELERVINTILFARQILGKEGTLLAVSEHRDSLAESEEWLPVYFKQMITGWLLRQKAANYEAKGEEILLQKLTAYQIAHHVDAVNSSQDAEHQITVSQFIGLLTIGMLHNLKSVNYSHLNREVNLGGDSSLTKAKSSWMFNWQPESVYENLQWIQGTGQNVLDDPVDMVMNYPQQFLKFGHFVSALLVVSETRATKMKRVFTKKTTDSNITPIGPHTIWIPSGTKFKPPKDIDIKPSTTNNED